MATSNNQKTVFILGAGASKELDLPTGDELKSQIAKDLSDVLNPRGYNHSITTAFTKLSDASHPVDQYMRQDSPPGFRTVNARNAAQQAKGQDLAQYRRACLDIRDGMSLALSIDNFLHQRRPDPYIETCGKLAIAHAILAAERNSKIFYSRG